MRIKVKLTGILFILMLFFINGVFAQEFTFDEWLSLYEEGFFGEVQELPPEVPSFQIDALGLRFVLNDSEDHNAEIIQNNIIEDSLNEESMNRDLNQTGFNTIITSVFPQNRTDTAIQNKNESLGLRIISSDDLTESKNLSSETTDNRESSSTFIWEEFFDDDDLLFFEGPSLVIEAPKFEMRSFDDIFPNFTRRQRTNALSRYGLRYYFTKNDSPNIIPNPDSGIDILRCVMARNPSHLVEALIVVPYNEKEFDLLDIYNALSRISNIKDYPIPLLNGSFNIFPEATRIISSRNRRAIPDPEPAKYVPVSETIYIRLKEANIGNLFIRGEITVSLYGITYNMTNFTDIRYFILPVMGAERFSTILYLEPVTEGVLIYCMAGFYLPDFVADRVNLTPNINRRIQVFIDWITDGLRKQE